MYGRGPSSRDDIANHRGGPPTLAHPKKEAPPGFFSKRSLRPKGGSASARLTRRRLTRLRPRVRKPSPPLTQTEGVQHPRITPVYQNAIPEPGARRGSTPCSTSTDEMIWTRKNTNSVSRLKFFQSTVDDESESKFYIQKKFPTPHHLINRMQITRNISPHGL